MPYRLRSLTGSESFSIWWVYTPAYTWTIVQFVPARQFSCLHSQVCAVDVGIHGFQRRLYSFHVLVVWWSKFCDIQNRWTYIACNMFLTWLYIEKLDCKQKVRGLPVKERYSCVGWATKSVNIMKLVRYLYLIFFRNIPVIFVYICKLWWWGNVTSLVKIDCIWYIDIRHSARYWDILLAAVIITIQKPNGRIKR
jgi:hypothetical protein